MVPVTLRLRDCQWQGCGFNNEVSSIASIRSAFSLISAL